MNKIKVSFLMGFLLMGGAVSPSFALLGAFVQTANSARQAAYEQFMMLKMVQQLKIMRDNYVASVRYYEKFKELNKGKGFVNNVANKVADVGKDQLKITHAQFKDDWVEDPATESEVDRYIKQADDYLSEKIIYAGQAFEMAIKNQEKAEQISNEAPHLNPSAKQESMVKNQALQIQLMSQMNRNLAVMIDLQTKILTQLLDYKKTYLKRKALING